ncbi:MAG: hypothetical protein LBM75_06330 [Myxococcales bacterium]|jgi:hypothetical protein|nr:hypothetical protein [Myxococcales bacterium]
MSSRSAPNHLKARHIGRAVFISSVAIAMLLSAPLAFAQRPHLPGTDGVAPVAEQTAPRDMLQRSSKTIERMRRSLTMVLAKLQEARDSKDVVKLNCVNDRLTDIKSMLRISEQADVTLQEAVARQDLSRAVHAFGTVGANGKKIDQLATESEQCIGMLAFDTVGTSLTVEEPNVDFWGEDPTRPSEIGGVGDIAISRPVVASPIQ